MKKIISRFMNLDFFVYTIIFSCILLLYLVVNFTPDFVAKNFSPDGILEQRTIIEINCIRFGFFLLSLIGLIIGIIKPELYHLLPSKFFNINSTKLLISILLIDLIFISIHSLGFYYPSHISKMFYIDMDLGFPEIFQYIKWLFIIILMMYICKKMQSFCYMAWALFFTYFLLDDALQIHELVGYYYFEKKFDFIPPFGLRMQDIGELSSTMIAGIILSSFLVWAYFNGNQTFKNISHDMLLFILAMVFFGVFVDMVDVAIKPSRNMHFILEIIEDGGEMMVASFIVWYVFLIATRDKNTFSYICNFNFLPK